MSRIVSDHQGHPPGTSGPSFLTRCPLGTGYFQQQAVLLLVIPDPFHFCPLWSRDSRRSPCHPRMHTRLAGQHKGQ